MILDTIKKFCLERKIKWSTHAASRIRERGLNREDILECIKNGELIEDYPEDFPHRSCLIYGRTIDNRIIHVVVGCDEEYVYIITAYVPNLQKFESDLKTRKGVLIMCFYCKCKTTIPSVTTHVVTLENCVIIVKNVPCEECEQCGEKYFSDEVMEQLDRIIDKAQALASEIFITDYNHRAA